VNEETKRFLALRGWLRLVVGSCTWCATRQAVAQIELEAGRRHEPEKGYQCNDLRRCDAKARLFWHSMPRKGEVCTEALSVCCQKCRNQAFGVKSVGSVERVVVVCARCAEMESVRV
jgi:hypothetical protein